MNNIWEAIAFIAMTLVILAFLIGYTVGHNEGVEDGWEMRDMLERKRE